jgi:hypothetical protein
MRHPARRVFLLLALAAAALWLSSCAGSNFQFLGYTVGPRHDAAIRTIRVPIFRNRTFVRDVEFEVTEAVIRRIEAATPWKVVRSGPADAELLGTVVRVPKHLILPNELAEIREADLTLGVEVVFHNTCTGANLMRPGELPVLPPIIDPLHPPDAPPPAPAVAPVLVQRTASFIPELGQSYATARQRVVQEVAVQIVNMMECPW